MWYQKLEKEKPCDRTAETILMQYGKKKKKLRRSDLSVNIDNHIKHNIMDIVLGLLGQDEIGRLHGISCV